MFKILTFFLISLLSYGETRPFIQIGADIPVVKNPTKTIEVQSGYGIDIGVSFDTKIEGFNTENFETQLFVGYKVDKYDRKRKKNKPVNITLKRMEFTALEIYNYDNDMSFGLGLSYHISPKADYHYIYKKKMRYIERKFDSTLAGIIQLGYKVNDNMSINLKTTISNYSISVKRKKKTYFRSYNTSSLGLFLTYKF